MQLSSLAMSSTPPSRSLRPFCRLCDGVTGLSTLVTSL